jgi:redox-sensitive bicupin YhaK (pirin superfamily)
MTAGSGILHQEMPKGDPQGRMHGFQLWANLPSSLKMTAPRYQDIPSTAIPEVADDDGTRVRVICGEFWGKKGPVAGVAADPSYLDVFVPAGRRSGLPSRPRAMPSLTSSRAPARSVTPRIRGRC